MTTIFATLEQGKIYIDLQKKILDGSLEKNIKKRTIGNLRAQRRKEGMQNTNNTTNQNELTKEQIRKYIQLKMKFNNLLSQYKISQEKLIIETNANLAVKPGKNVYVNSVINNPTASYLGSYNDSSSMTTLNNGAQNYNYTNCMTEAVNSNNTYFGLENVDPTTQLSQCNIGSDIDAARKGGIATNGCFTGSDGKKYGAFNSNTTAIYSTIDSAYKGCYKNSSPLNMDKSGIDLERYSSVYVLGPIGTSPWTNTTGFPDTTAQWIWYSANAQNGAPVNTDSPMTFIYGYNYTGPNYITATVNAINDDSGIWYLNSIQVATVAGGWGGPGTTFNITIAPGMNYLQCSAVNASGPAGLIATVTYNGQVLFNTNSAWKYTNLPVSSMIVNGSNYSVETCQQYANNNGYQYFGLQNGGNGTSECVVSNSFQTATEYGSSDPTTILSDGYSYGIGNVNSLYQVTTQGANSDFLGKMGYVDDSLQVKEYPTYMINPSSSPDVLPTILDSDSSCPQSVEAIDSIAWGKLDKIGTMTPFTKCGLKSVIDELQKQVDSIKGQLAITADEMLTIISNLKKNNENINTQLNIDETTMVKNVELYQRISNKFSGYKDSLNNNVNSMLSDSTSLVNYENYHYIFWGVLAATIVIVTLHTINR